MPFNKEIDTWYRGFYQIWDEHDMKLLFPAAMIKFFQLNGGRRQKTKTNATDTKIFWKRWLKKHKNVANGGQKFKNKVFIRLKKK